MPPHDLDNRSITVSPYDGDGRDWDAFVRGHPGWTHFHLYGWRRVVARVFRHECIYLAARDAAGRIVGILPLVRVRSLVFGHYLVSMPFLNYGGPLGGSDAVRALAEEAKRIGSRAGVKLLELRSRTELPIDWHASHRKLTVLLDLPPEPEKLWAGLPSKLRSQVKRPRKDGVTVRHGLDQLDPFYRVFAHHMRDLGTPAQSKRLFESIAEEFPNDVHFAVAYHQDLPIACGCGFLWDREFEITWASALRSHSAMSPNMLVYWELMERMTLAGAAVFNFGRCSPDSGTYRFKMQWGSREQRLWWYQQTQKSNPEEAATPSPNKGVFALATRVWQRLPVPIATKMGGPIVRGIP